MKKDNIKRIVESVIKGSTPFQTELDSINVHVYKIEKWNKYIKKYGNLEPDDVDTKNFSIKWMAEFEYEEDGIYGLTTEIDEIYGLIEIKFYNEESSNPRIEMMEFDYDDMLKMKIVNLPEFNSSDNKLIINGIQLDFSRNQIIIEYL